MNKGFEHKERHLGDLVEFLEKQDECGCIIEYGHNDYCPYGQCLMVFREIWAEVQLLMALSEKRKEKKWWEFWK